MSGRFIKLHGPTLLAALVIFVLSSIPSLKGPDLGFRFQDKVFHFLEFSIFGILLHRSFADRIRLRRWIVLCAICAGAAFAALDELHQGLVPGREADLMDFLADTAGLVFSGFLYCILSRKKYFLFSSFFY